MQQLRWVSLATLMVMACGVEQPGTESQPPSDEVASTENALSGCVAAWSHACAWRGTGLYTTNAAIASAQIDWIPAGGMIAPVSYSSPYNLACPMSGWYGAYRNGRYGWVYGPYFSPC